jgi:uncharacterized protein
MKTVRLRQSYSSRWPGEVQAALRDLQAALRRMYGRRAPRLLLYGSYARGDAIQASDVDVLLLYPQRTPPGSEIQRLGGILADLNLRYQVLISVLPASRDDLQTAQGAFWDNIRREGIALV